MTADVATGDPAFEAAPAPADVLVGTGSTFSFAAEHHGQHAANPLQTEGEATPAAGSRSIREQVFASASLFANPPPFAA
jgi:hypothetical protein